MEKNYFCNAWDKTYYEVISPNYAHTNHHDFSLYLFRKILIDCMNVCNYVCVLMKLLNQLKYSFLCVEFYSNT